MKKSRTNTVTLSNVESRPLERVKVLKNGKEIRIKLNDAELIKEAAKTIDAYTKEYGELPQGMQGNFIQWIREAAEAVDNGESIVQHKRMTVVRTIPDYSTLDGVTK